MPVWEGYAWETVLQRRELLDKTNVVWLVLNIGLEGDEIQVSVTLY